MCSWYRHREKGSKMSNGGGGNSEGDGKPTTGTSITEPRETGFAKAVTTLFESIGVLNKGSADSAATPTAGDAAQTAGVSSNALNVTRVGGLAAFIASVGAAAIAIFNVNKGTDRASIVVAAYISVGAIVAAGLLTAAIIISSDIRARAAVNPSPSSSSSPSGTAVGTDSAKAATADPNAFGDAWYRALSMLHDALARLEHTPVSPAQGWVDGATGAWLDAAASSGKTQNLHPADNQATLHARLGTGQARVVSLLEKLANDSSPADEKKTETIARITSVLNSMDQSLPWPN
jgi:hypothetical protein